MCGGKAKSAPPPVYKSIDGNTYSDPNQAADRDRQLQLAGAFGYDRSMPLEQWVASASPEYATYNNQGLTAADYRSEQRLKEQEMQAKAAEEQRKAAVAQGRAAVDTTFSGYNDDYYGGLSKSVTDYYLPQLDDQFKDAGEQLKFKQARQGILHSDTAGKEFADLQGKYDVQRAGITNRAADTARQAKENVSSAKSQLYSYADTAADPAAVNTRLESENARLRAYAPELTPMGQIFSDYITPVLQTLGSGAIAESQGYRGFNTGLFNTAKKNDSYNVKRAS